MVRLSVSVQKDHLERLAASPTAGLAELIWNAVDADANRVEVEYDRGPLGGVDAIRVIDDGHGMTPDEIASEFGQLGGSWKRLSTKSRVKGRSLHGKSGQGRWRAFGLGGDWIVWETIAEDDGRRVLTRIQIARSNLGEVEISDPEPTDRSVGTTAVIGGISDAPRGVADDKLAARLITRLGLYLAKYPVTVVVDGHVLDPRSGQVAVTEIDIPPSPVHGAAQLTVIEWKTDVTSLLYLCDEDGAALEELPAGVQAPGYSFTGYLRSPVIRQLETELALADLGHSVLGPLVEAARDALRAHFRRRSKERAAHVIEAWRAEDVYPYAEPVTDSVAKVQRDVFDVVAYTAAETINASRNTGSKRLALRLLKQALASEPSSVARILEEVLHLPKDQIDQLSRLLNRTTLAAIISSARLVANRLDFLRGLDLLLFHPESADQLKERSQLHKIVRNETWIFREEFALAVDDKSLTETLKRHIALLGRDELADDAPVLDPSGRPRIIDLMLAGSMEQTHRRREHVVVELKRPNVTIGAAELTQIENYAFAVAEDSRFDTVEVDWDFWVVSNELDAHARRRSRQAGQPAGQVHKSDDGRVRVWAVTWAELIEDARHRMKFVERQLGYIATDESAVGYLREQYEKFLPNAVSERPSSPASAAPG